MRVPCVTKLNTLIQMSLCRVELKADTWLLLRPAETRYSGRLNLILFVISDGKGRRFVL